MSFRRFAPLAAAVALATALAAGCAARRPPKSTLDGPQVGVYRGRVEPADGRARRFRLLLFAALPDRLHGEVVSPVGSTEMIVDGGEGRLAVTVVRDRVSYVGPARADALERILGVRLTLEELVGGLLTGELEDESWRVNRAAAEAGTLPTSIEFRSSAARLWLELKRLRPLRADPETLGRGEPPPGTERRPLEEIGPGQRIGEPESDAG